MNFSEHVADHLGRWEKAAEGTVLRQLSNFSKLCRGI